MMSPSSLLLAVLLLTCCLSLSWCGNIEYVSKTVDSSVVDLQWADLTTVYLLTQRGTLYLSTDSGRTFSNQARRLSNAVIMKVSISPINPQHVFFTGKLRGNWRTTDGGKSYKLVDGVDVVDVRLHPTKASYLLASSRSAACTVDEATGAVGRSLVSSSSSSSSSSTTANSESTDCYKTLFVSRDFGESWQHLLDYVVQFDWSPVVGIHDRSTGDHGATDTLLVTAHRSKHGTQRFGTWSRDIDFLVSDDYFRTVRTLVEHGNRFIFGDQALLFVATVNPHDETQVTLKVCRDNTTRVDFHTAVLPVELTEHSYTVLDTSEGSVFLHVNHAPVSDGAYTGHVYMSDYTGLSYTLSLPYNHRNSEGRCDFEKVRGVEGVYVANFVDELQMDEEERAEESSSLLSTSSLSGSMARVADRRNRIRVKTVITFDKGGDWNYLTPPMYDSMHQRIQCEGECHLHLYGATGPYGPFYTNENALGLILATGTIGSFLGDVRTTTSSQNGENGNAGAGSTDSGVNTYMSRDAGVTWSEVAKGSHIYEFGDHGALVLMAKDRIPTDTILYSWDEGTSWSALHIADTPFVVENIITEPDSTSQQFVVYGRSGTDSTSGVLVYVNFDELHEATCKGHDAPDTPDSDYETWSPSDAHPHPSSSSSSSPHCLLGRTITYVRRRADRACFNPDAFERPVQVEACPCQAADFECDYGYERVKAATSTVVTTDSSSSSSSSRRRHSNTPSVDVTASTAIGGTCVPMSSPPLHADPFSKHESCSSSSTNGWYRMTKGYRRVPGDTCVGGGEWEAQLLPCPSSFFGSGVGGALAKLMLVLLIFIVAALLGVTLLTKYDIMKDTVGQVVSRIDRLRSNSFLSRFSHSYGLLGQSQAPQTLMDDDAFYLSDEDAGAGGGGSHGNTKAAIPLQDSDVEKVTRAHHTTTTTNNNNTGATRPPSATPTSATSISTSSASSSSSSSLPTTSAFSALPVIRTGSKVPVLPGPNDSSRS